MMTERNRSNPVPRLLPIATLAALLLVTCSINAQAASPLQRDPFRPLITKADRTLLVSTGSGTVSAANVSDGCGRNAYQMQFITMEPGSVFLPVLLDTDMVFFVQSGNGSVSWWWAGHGCKNGCRNTSSVAIETGDVYRLPVGTIFYVESNPASDRSLQIHALFDATSAAHEEDDGVQMGRPYSNLTDMIRGFDQEILQMGFNVSEEVIQIVKEAESTPPIVPYADGQSNDTEAPSSNKRRSFRIMNRIVVLTNKESESSRSDNNRRRIAEEAVKTGKKDKHSPYNFLKETPDFQNAHGSGTIITPKELHALKGSRIGVSVLNLAEGSMLSPHWSLSACQIAVVMQGQGMVQLVHPASFKSPSKTTRLRAEEGDVVVVPRHHSSAHMSFANSTFRLVGFTTGVAAAVHKHKARELPYFLTGSWSVLRAFDRGVLALSFNVPNSTVDQLLSAADENDVFTACDSCAENEETRMMLQLEEGIPGLKR